MSYPYLISSRSRHDSSPSFPPSLSILKPARCVCVGGGGGLRERRGVGERYGRCGGREGRVEVGEGRAEAGWGRVVERRGGGGG